MQRQHHKGMIQLLIEAATSFMYTSPRSGAMSAVGSFSPNTSHFTGHSNGTSKGRHKHAAECRATAKCKRRRTYLKRMRRS